MMMMMMMMMMMILHEKVCEKNKHEKPITDRQYPVREEVKLTAEKNVSVPNMILN